MSLTWDPVDLAERYNLQHLDPETDGVTKVDPLDGAVTGTDVIGLTPETDVCFRLTVTRAGHRAALRHGLHQDRRRAADATPTPTPTDPRRGRPAHADPDADHRRRRHPRPTFSPGDPNTDPVMKQRWIAVAGVLPKTCRGRRAAPRAGAEEGLPGKYLDTEIYPRLLIDAATPPPCRRRPRKSRTWSSSARSRPSPTPRTSARGHRAPGHSTCFTAQPDPP